MASVECERNEEIALLSLEKKARLDEVIRKAELTLESEEVFNQCRAIVAENKCLDKAVAAGKVVVAARYLTNETKGTLTTVTDMQHQYEGEVIIVDYPSPLPSGYNGSFTMSATTDKGVEAAVVYSGKNKQGNADCGWLLGFLATNNTAKVYAKCGAIGEFMNLDWADVKTKIERGGSQGYYEDPTTRTMIFANINGGTSGNYAVSASFWTY